MSTNNLKENSPLTRNQKLQVNQSSLSIKHHPSQSSLAVPAQLVDEEVALKQHLPQLVPKEAFAHLPDLGNKFKRERSEVFFNYLS